VDPTGGLAHQNLATLHLRAGRLQDAEQELRLALGVDASLPGAHTAMGVVLSRTGRTAAAIDEWRQAVALDPSELDALYNLTVELFATGQTDEARRYGARYLDTAPPTVFARDIAHVRSLLGGGRF